jgi:cytochrome c2
MSMNAEHASEDLPDVECGVGEIPAYDEVSIFDKCTMCHSSELSGSAQGGPGSFNLR